MNGKGSNNNKCIVVIKAPTDNPIKFNMVKYYGTARAWYINQEVDGKLIYKWQRVRKQDALDLVSEGMRILKESKKD